MKLSSHAVNGNNTMMARVASEEKRKGRDDCYTILTTKTGQRMGGAHLASSTSTA